MCGPLVEQTPQRFIGERPAINERRVGRDRGRQQRLESALDQRSVIDVQHVERRLVDQGPASFWTFCVDYMDRAARPTEASRSSGARAKVDYKDVLKPEEFSVFARLREERKKIAEAEAVPVYTIFNNDQLAQMVQTRASNRSALEKIAGVGNARVEKYGNIIIDIGVGS